MQGLFAKIERATSHAQNKTTAASEFGEAAIQATATLRAQSVELNAAISQSGDARASQFDTISIARTC